MDGSAGSVFFSAKVSTLKFKTSHQTTSTAVELAALRSAHCIIREEPPNKWSVFSDSKAALHCLLSALHRGPYEQLVLEIRELLHRLIEQGHDVTFQWLPSHCGVMGNEYADEAARSAHEDGAQEPIPLSRTDAAAKLRVIANDATQSL